MEKLFAGDCIRTFTGKYFNVFEPDPELIDIVDIAHALSHQCRFGGHLPVFYSVAQHSCLCADLSEQKNKFAALMHDASEAYLLDIPRPIKLRLANYKEIEDGVMQAIAKKFDFEYPLNKEIKRVDEEALQIEWDNVFIEVSTFINFKILSSQKSKEIFLKLFKDLA